LVLMLVLVLRALLVLLLAAASAASATTLALLALIGGLPAFGSRAVGAGFGAGSIVDGTGRLGHVGWLGCAVRCAVGAGGAARVRSGCDGGRWRPVRLDVM
jgi:hypothetical protein